ncbi:MAG TPA: branched-chain amino acid ABC transporter substrate-binding protein [Azospirillaceae bacterium]|nr:branched-chain amino acid ABC transporter substrate-binding protein [Azospirillaceae bacterium]
MRQFLLAAAVSLALAPSAHADIKVGFAAPLTGPVASVGEHLRRGAEQAVADINARGGVLGEKLTLVVADDAGVPAQAVAVANWLVRDGVRMVVGHLQTGTTIPASQVYADEGVVVITPTATSPDVTAGGLETVFRTCGRDDQQGAVAGAWLAERYRGRKVAIVHDQTTYGKGIADAVKAAMNAGGLQEAVYTALTSGERDFSALVTRLKAAEVEAVFFGGIYSDAGLLVRQARGAGLAAQFLSGDTLASDEFWAIAGDTGEGLMMTYSADVKNSAAAADLVARFRAAGYDPASYALYSYAALQVWAQAAEKAGTADGLKVAAALRGAEYPTVIGPLAYDARGDRTRADYVLYRWSNGRFAPAGAS